MTRKPRKPLDERLLEMRDHPSPDDYARAQAFRNILKQSNELTTQQKRTLYGQAIHGDLDGAWKGYKALMGR